MSRDLKDLLANVSSTSLDMEKVKEQTDMSEYKDEDRAEAFIQNIIETKCQ